MRLTRPLAVVLAGAFLLGSVWSTEAAAAPSKTKQIAAAFKKARTLYRQGKYQEAIRAFDEVKDLKYHPILDYGIANCYSALRQYNKGIYYLEKYIKNHSKHKMSPKHPTAADVKVKIGSWRKLAASAGTTGGTDPTAPGTGTSGGGTAPPPPGGTGTGGTGAGTPPGHVAGDPLPGPDPYAVPPPPGGGATGGVYGHGGGGAPPPPGVRRRRTPARRSLILSVDLGAAAFSSGGDGAPTANAQTGFGIFGTAMWRIIPWLAVGVHGGVTAVGSDELEHNALIFGVGVLEARGIIPIRRIDIWFSFGAGYGALSQRYIDDSGYDSTYSVGGAAIAAGAGLDWFLSSFFSLGVVGRLYKMFPQRECINDSVGDDCYDLTADQQPGFAWYAGLAVTYHFPLRFGRKRR